MDSIRRERAKEIGRFLLVGGGSFLIDYGFLYLFTEFAGIGYLYSSAFSFTISVLVNYWLCIVYVFPRAGKQSRLRTFLFFASSIAGLGLNQLCMWFLVEKVSIHYMLAKILATGIVTLWNYVAKRKAVAE